MTKKERNKLLQPIANELGLVVHSDFAYKIIEYDGFKIMLGLLFDASSIKTVFRPYYFGQCLFVPAKILNLGFGDTITWPHDNRMTDYWDVDSYMTYKHLISTKFLDFMNTITSFQSFLSALVKGEYPFFNNNIYKAEICAYINTILRNKKDAFTWSEIVSLQPNPMNLYYMEDIKQRATDIITLLSKDDYDAIFRLFLRWQDETIKSLGLRTQS